MYELHISWFLFLLGPFNLLALRNEMFLSSLFFFPLFWSVPVHSSDTYIETMMIRWESYACKSLNELTVVQMSL